MKDDKIIFEVASKIASFIDEVDKKKSSEKKNSDKK